MCRARRVQDALVVTALGIGVVIEHHGLRTPGHADCTWSAWSRTRGHTQHPVGAALVVAGWLAFTAWYLPHICRRITKTIQEA